ncbi:MAG: PKD domain-containing protein, partial [Mycobacterium sp.]|nr:PKD domain-containing protein [Mycobacterium sp.]
QQGAVQERNADGASIGLLRTYFIRDVASADGAAAGAAAAGTDCSGGDGAAATANETVLRLDGEDATYIVYNETTSSDGEGLSIWRRECDGSTLLASAEIADRLATGATIVTCGPRYGAPASDCGKVNFRVGTLAGEFVSMTATVRTGEAIAAPSGPVYVSPVVVISISPTVPVDGVVTVYRGDTVTFDASASSNPTGGALDHLWNFGDGTTSTNAVASKTFTALGEFTAIYTATNSDGTPASDYVRIKVENRKPTAVISSPANGFSTTRCTNVSFAAAGSNDSGDSAYGGSVVEYRWTYGDGTTATKTSAASHTHQFAQLSPGNGTNPQSVGLTVVDNEGAESTQVVRSVTVTNRPPNTPTITGNGNTANVSSNGPVTVNFASNASDPDICATSNETLSYEWDWGDGSAKATTATASKTFSNGGSYQVRLKVTDGAGVSRTSSPLTVTINGLPTAAFALSSTSVRAGSDLTSPGWITNSSSDPEGQALTYSWSFQNANPPSGGNSSAAVPSPVRFTHNVGSNNTFIVAVYNVTLTVTDPLGGQGTATRQVTVNGAPAPGNLRKTGQGCENSNWTGCQERYINLAWNSVPQVDRYQVNLECTTGGCGQSVTREYTGTTAHVDGLSEGFLGITLSYDIRIRSRDSVTGKWGPWSATINENSG